MSNKFFMSLIWLLVASLLPGASIADRPAETRSFCTTSSRSTSAANVPTYTWALSTTRHASVIVTSTAIQTITPSPVTTTLTSTTIVTSTTSASGTQVCTDSVFIELHPEVFAPATTTVVTSTISSTLTQEAGTSTISTPAGFVPIQTSAPNATFQNPLAQARDEAALGFYHHARSHVRRAADQASKNVAVADVHSHSANVQGVNRVQQTSSSMYPYEVGCVDLVTAYQTVTSTQAASTTETRTAAAATVTTTKVVSSTCVSTVGAHSYTTTYITQTAAVTTVTPTSTQTRTNTATVTYKHPAATVHAQCAANNFVNTIHGDYGLFAASNTNNVDYVLANGTFNNQVECCELCATTSTCAGSGYDAQKSTCYLLNRCGVPIQVVSDAEAEQDFHAPASMLSPLTLSNGCVNAVSCPNRGQVCIPS